MKRIGKTLAAVMLAGTMTTSAAVVEFQAERTIINVEEMDLTGDENVLDILLMYPDVITLDGISTRSGLLGGYRVRIDNIDISVDESTLMTTLRAREISKIKICHDPSIQKGTGGLNQVIDINLRKEADGTTARVSATGDTYGSAGVTGMVKHFDDDVRVIGMVQGAQGYEHTTGSAGSRGTWQAAKANVAWDITEKDNLEVDLAQNYSRTRENLGMPEYNRYYTLTAIYTRQLAPNGAYALLQAGGDFNCYSMAGKETHDTYPYALAEFGFPFFSKNSYFDIGVEAGYSGVTSLDGNYTNRSRYEDLYWQLDWNFGKLQLSVGDRLRVLSFWVNSLSESEFEHSTHNNAVHLSAIYKFTQRSQVQGIFQRRYYNPDFENFITLDGAVPVYTTAYDQREAYISELRYSYARPDLMVSGLLKNVHQELDEGHDNTLGIGATVFWRKSWLSLTAGANYYWEKTTLPDGNEYNNYVNLKLQPQIDLGRGWGLEGMLLYNSRKAYDSSLYTAANCYADVELAKDFGKHLQLRCRYHDIADQRTGNRGVSLSATYYIGSHR